MRPFLSVGSQQDADATLKNHSNGAAWPGIHFKPQGPVQESGLTIVQLSECLGTKGQRRERVIKPSCVDPITMSTQGLNMCHSYLHRGGGSQENEVWLCLLLTSSHWPAQKELAGEPVGELSGHLSGAEKEVRGWAQKNKETLSSVEYNNHKTHEKCTASLETRRKRNFKYFYIKFGGSICKAISSITVDLIKQGHSIQLIEVKISIVSGRLFGISSYLPFDPIFSLIYLEIFLY